MPAKTWDDDFRKDAIDASLQKLGDEYLDDPFQYDGSFCLPVGEKPNQGWGWTPFWIGGYVFLAIFVLEAAVIIYVIVCFAHGINPFNWIVLLIPGGMLAGSGVHQFLISRRGEKLILGRLLKDRLHTRLEEFDTEHVIPCELIDPDSNERRYFDSHDQVLVFLDVERRRLLIEGVTARYQIRAEDVVCLRNCEWTGLLAAYRSGALLTCRIDETTELSLAAVREPGYYEERQQSLLWLFLSRSRRDALKKNALIGPFKRMLQYSDAAGGPKEEIEAETL
jgi:hypothetical protein